MRWLMCLMLLVAGFGCAEDDPLPRGRDMVLVVPGVGGDGPEYNAFCRGLLEGGVNRAFITVPWGAPKPFFMMNFSDPEVHETAEQALADKIIEATHAAPDRRIDLIGHSAGGGVVVGALKKLPPAIHVNTVLLLAPSFSPQYDVAPALDHITVAMHLFYSDRDTFFLDWRTSSFGTYDNVKSRAAGNVGLPATQSTKLIQHPYDPTWDRFDNDGGHYGPIAQPFARNVLAPLLK
jgi:pimeloyl-ACP methyl ester carboxylesterase